MDVKRVNRELNWAGVRYNRFRAQKLDVKADVELMWKWSQTVSVADGTLRGEVEFTAFVTEVNAQLALGVWTKALSDTIDMKSVNITILPRFTKGAAFYRFLDGQLVEVEEKQNWQELQDPFTTEQMKAVEFNKNVLLARTKDQVFVCP